VSGYHVYSGSMSECRLTRLRSLTIRHSTSTWAKKPKRPENADFSQLRQSAVVLRRTIRPFPPH
jgi:hypothetical protein